MHPVAYVLVFVLSLLANLTLALVFIVIPAAWLIAIGYGLAKGINLFASLFL